MRIVVDPRHAFAGTLAFLVIAGLAGAAPAASAAGPSPAGAARLSAPKPVAAVRCLGGALNDDASATYLTLDDYPNFAPPLGPRRLVICGDRIPPMIRAFQLNGGFGRATH